MHAIRRIHWGRIVVAGLMAEATVFSIFFALLLAATLAGVPELAEPESTLDYIDALVSSFASVFVFTIWVGRRIESGFVLHGILVGLTAMLLFLGLIFGFTGSVAQPSLYWVAHGLKLLGGLAGGLVVERGRRRAVGVEAAQVRA